MRAALNELLLALDSSLAFSCHVASGNLGRMAQRQALVLSCFIGLLYQHLSLTCLFWRAEGILEECKDGNSRLYIRFQ